MNQLLLCIFIVAVLVLGGLGCFVFLARVGRKIIDKSEADQKRLNALVWWNKTGAVYINRDTNRDDSSQGGISLLVSLDNQPELHLRHQPDLRVAIDAAMEILHFEQPTN